MIAQLARKPKRQLAEPVYSNFDHVLNKVVADVLLHDHSTYAQHAAATYCGYVYCVIEDDVLKWYEEVWTVWTNYLTEIYRDNDLSKLIALVVNEYGGD